MFCKFVIKPSEKMIVNLDCLIYTFFADFPKIICKLENRFCWWNEWKFWNKNCETNWGIHRSFTDTGSVCNITRAYYKYVWIGKNIWCWIRSEQRVHMMLNQVGANSTWYWIRYEQIVHDAESGRSKEYMILNKVGANSTWCRIRSEKRVNNAKSGRSKE